MKINQLILLAAFYIGVGSVQAENNLPEGFVYLDEIAPSIIQNLRYYGDENFIGRRVAGYLKPRALLTKEAALALKRVQEQVMKDGYSLVVYDAYRPQKASDDFFEWSKDAKDKKMHDKYYPYIDKATFFEKKYVAAKSSHSRGSTVDITIIKLGENVSLPPKLVMRKLKDGRQVPYLDDNTVDMYTSFDLMDEASHWENYLIPEVNKKERLYLRAKMIEGGFEEYPYEWWHYTLKNEPYKDIYFDFDVK